MTAARGRGEVLALRDVSVRHGGGTILHPLDWVVRSGERWVVLGPNGSGKTTLLRVASLYLHPSTGSVVVDGEELGRTDVRVLRTRIGLASPAFGDLLRPALTAREAVMTGRFAALEPWWHDYGPEDAAHAEELLAAFGVEGFGDRRVGSLSSGERQRVLLARAFSGRPALVLLDEPTAGLDLGGREDLVGRLERLGRDPDRPPSVLVTHHVEEIPASTTHVLLLRDGHVLEAGPLSGVLTAPALSAAFGVEVRLERRGDRWTAWA
ncbi:MAG: ABC transporter ATP-binding protein [Actinomycetota bacterium]